MDYYDGKDCGRDLGRTESLRKDKPWAEAIQDVTGWMLRIPEDVEVLAKYQKPPKIGCPIIS
jgi:hypothetical protein